MKIGELASGLKVMITNEQRQLFDELKNGELNRADLDPRKQRIAEQLTSQGLIDRIYNEETETISYKLFSK